jgi:peroxiredoxin
LLLVGLLVCWLGWQLLRQNGRILLELDEFEKRLDDLEFAALGDPESSANNEVADHPNAGPHPGPLPQGEGEHRDRASCFGNRSLARSKIKRDGLKAGTSAPSFRLPRLDGGELSLDEILGPRGKRVLLVFSDPHCGPCNALAPQLEIFHRDHAEISVVMIGRGQPKENRAKAKEHGLTFPVVLQRQWEISRRYAIFATPVAYLIDQAGIITHDVAVGVEPILQLLAGVTGTNQFIDPAAPNSSRRFYRAVLP